MILTVDCLRRVVQCLSRNAAHGEFADTLWSSSPASCGDCRPQSSVPCLQDYEVFFHKRKGVALYIV